MAELIPRRFLPLALASFLIGVILLAFGYLGADEGENGDARGYVVILVILVIVGYLAWRYVVQPETAGAGSARAALVLGVVALLTGLLYWVGLAWVLGPAAIALGTMVRERLATGTGQNAQEATIGVALGWAGLTIATVLGILDQL
jgi:hypothetical protein